MALTDAEVDQIRYELGYHILQPGAAPYITDRSLFKQVIQPYVEGQGETIVRDILEAISNERESMKAPAPGSGLSGTQLANLIAQSGGLKKLDEVEFYPGSASSSNSYSTTASSVSSGGVQFANAKARITYWRNELASSLGVENLWEYSGRAASVLEAY